jgi:hypothetical protein
MNSKFYDMYSKYKSGLGGKVLDKLSTLKTDEEADLFNDKGERIDVKESRIMNLDHHVVKIEQLGDKVSIKSMLDPKINGEIKYDSVSDASLAYKALNTSRNVISYMRNHYKGEPSAHDWSKIMFDEVLARKNMKREEAKAMGAESEDMFNDGEGEGSGGGGDLGGGDAGGDAGGGDFGGGDAGGGDDAPDLGGDDAGGDAPSPDSGGGDAGGEGSGGSI